VLAAHAYAAATHIPPDMFGNGQSVFGDKNVYKVQLVFQLKNSNQAFNDGGAFALTLQGSDSYQNVSLIDVQGVNVRDIYRDIYGNVVLLSSDIEPAKLPQNVKIVMSVTVSRTKVNKAVVSNEIIDVSELYKAGETIPTKAALLQAAEEYRNSVNSKATKNKNKIYHQKVFDLFPIEDTVYHEAMVNFAKILADQGISPLMLYGWNIPEYTDYVARDFVLKVLTKDCGVVYLNKTLKEYSSDGTHIWWNALPPNLVTDYENNFIYTGVAQNVLVENKMRLSNQVLFTDSTLYLSVGKVKNQVVDKRFESGYDKIIVTQKSKTPQKIMLLKTKLSKYPDAFTLFTRNAKSPQPTAAANTNKPAQTQNSGAAKPQGQGDTAQNGSSQNDANPYITSVTFCKNVENSKAIGPRQTFLSSDTVYVLVSLKSTQSAKNVFYQWVTPSGNNHFKKTTTVPGNWGSYYTYTNANGKMEKGVWKFIITINGVSKTVSFTVQ
ncbi:MAG: hypothetical protein J6Y01_03985, partial [Spirochaetales bacterium]|nr:hypothetical protein [Spirochaetales bacterium]